MLKDIFSSVNSILTPAERCDGLMYPISIECRISLALAEDSNVRTTILADLDMNLGTFTVIFRLSPNLMRGCKML
jgi:hypothetical protein